MKRLKRKDKVKRGRIILSAILTIAIAFLSLAFGVYLGYITLNINYLTIGTMTYEVGGLLIVAGFFIFFGCFGGVISFKEIFISSRNEERFSAYKGALYSAVVYYIITAIISVAGIVTAFISYIPSNYVWTIIGLSVFALLLCAGAFYCVLRELKEHKKKNKQKADDMAFANMELSASDIHKLKCATVTAQEESKQNNLNSYSEKEVKERVQDDFNKQEVKRVKEEIDLYSLVEKLMQLEELKANGIISEWEYHSLRNKIF